MKRLMSIFLVVIMLFSVLFTTPATAVSTPAKPVITSLSNTDNSKSCKRQCFWCPRY